jgi:hypothetical protein
MAAVEFVCEFAAFKLIGALGGDGTAKFRSMCDEVVVWVSDGGLAPKCLGLMVTGAGTRRQSLRRHERWRGAPDAEP